MHKNTRKTMSRRNFLGTASCSALGYTTLLSSLINLKAINAATANSLLFGGSNDYKALVCILLSGGNDSYNMLMPHSIDEYNTYAATRSNLAIAREGMLPIFPQNAGGREFGLHPALPELKEIFDKGDLAFLANTGTLIEPVENREQVWDEVVRLPLGLFSHSDQVQQWQTAFPHERSAIGWGGKIADLVKDMNQNQQISMNISLAGTNVFQSGESTIEFAIDPNNGSTGIIGYGEAEEWDVFNQVRTDAIDNLIDQNYQNIFQKTYIDVIRHSRDANLLFSSALEGVEALDVAFNDNYVSNSFRMIARTIAARETLGMKRQIFFLDFGGWDHHDEVLQSQQDMFTVLSQGLKQFYDALQSLGVLDCVTTFSLSEFGRTLTSNGNGTDHGWGGNVMMMGGAVKGNNIYGTYPSLALGNPLEIGGGVLVPTTSADEYFAELAIWFGVSPGDLDLLFPNLSNFYSPGASTPPIGFLDV